MSMLAEPRKKQKWSVDPRNSTWSKDENKFGQKMLERMGWSKGKGLGRSQQGSTEHVKVKVKNNSYGLGANTSYEDKWIAHQDDFNELLAHLNSCHGQNDHDESPSEEQKGFSLEEKSKTAKKRVHYMKFTKGKDLSSRSEKDLNCIFGKRVQPSKELEQESNSSDSQEEKGGTTATVPSELDTESITKTVTSTLTMQEYFAQRMAHLKKTRGQAHSPETSETSGQSGEISPMHCVRSSAEQLHMKKKKRDKRAAYEAEVSEEKCDTFVVEKCEYQDQIYPEKNKKRKIYENATLADEMPLSKKKKHKKEKKDTKPINGHVLAKNEKVEFEVFEAKKDSEEGHSGVQKDTTEEEQTSKKDKKKKKKRAKTFD